MADTIRYKRLPGRKRGLLQAASLWSGEDHLLAVSGWRFTEDYKRYYYRDIQAIVVTRMPRFVVSTGYLLSVAVTLAGWITVAAAGARGRAWLFFALIFAANSLLFAFFSIARSCRCRILTAVSSDELPSLYRVGDAQKVLRIVEPVIAAAQASLPPMPAFPAEAPAAAPIPGIPEPGSPQVVPAAAATRRVSAWELISYLVLSGAAAAGFAHPPLAVWAAIMLGAVALAITVLVEHRSRGGATVARGMAIAIIVFISAMSCAGMLASILARIENQQAAVWAAIELSVRNVTATGCGVLASVGLVAAARRRFSA